MTNISNKAAFLLLLLAFSVLPVFAQAADTGAQSSQSTAVSQDAVDGENTDNFFSNWNQTPEAPEQEPPSTLGLFIRMVLVLALVVAAIYGVMLLMKKGMKITVNDDDPFLRKVSQVTLSPGKSVQVVTLFNHAYLVGVTEGSINLIGEIDDKDLVDSMNLYADQNSNVKKPRTFADILSIFMPNAASAEENAETSATGASGSSANVFSNSAESAAEELQRQRDRLNGGQA